MTTKKVSNTSEVPTTKDKDTTDKAKSVVKVTDKAVKKADIADEALIGKPTEPLYQKKVFIVDLNNIGFKIAGEGQLTVDVLEVKDDKATVKNGDLTMEVPKEFLF